tara:strand:+ start:1638 stop:1883 length:246 start_codon:yes stop_codon:yes gene_type:complete
MGEAMVASPTNQESEKVMTDLMLKGLQQLFDELSDGLTENQKWDKEMRTRWDEWLDGSREMDDEMDEWKRVQIEKGESKTT